MNPRTKIVLGYIGIGVAAALLTGAVVWALMSARLEAESERADSALEQVDDLEAQVAAASAESTGAQDTPSSQPESDEPTATADAPAQASAESTERRFCFVKSVRWEGATALVTVDYAEILNGDAAAAAATAHGDESPPPNDYYIVNDNPKLREFPADKNLTVKVVSQSGGGVVTEGYGMALGAWCDVLAGMSADDFVTNRPYWITIKKSTIVALEEQFLP